MLIADIDHFKRINDTWGHEAGDAVLKGFAQRIIDGLRALDLAARYGGEEFVIMMPGAGLAEAAIAADRLRSRVESAAFEIPGADPVNVTVSIGLAQLTAGEDMDSLLRRADTALYEAKTDGRNRIQAATNAAA